MQLVSRALVPIRVLEQIELVIVLRVVPWPSLDDLCHDLLSLGRKMLCLDRLCDLLGDAFLFGAVREDDGTIFCVYKFRGLKCFEEKVIHDVRLPTSPPWRFAVVGSCVR
jgi:hypothetical protein